MMDFKWTSTPQLYGVFHIGIVIIMILTILVLKKWCTSKSDCFLLKIMHIIGAIMIVAEAWKQWFCFTYVMHGHLSLWYLPFQLCSLSMYLSFIIVYLNEKLQNVLLVFLATFSFVAALGALIYPEDMLRPYIWLTLHGFIFHGLMMLISVMSIILIRRRRITSFMPTVILFGCLTLMAAAINLLCHVLLLELEQPNMFYISPYMTIERPILTYIQVQYGYLTETAFYLGGIILLSFVMFRLIIKWRRT